MTEPTEPLVANTAAGRRGRVAMAVLVGVAVAVLVTLETSRAAFSASTANTGNRFRSGSVEISDDDTGSTMFAVDRLTPGDQAQRCINVAYAGSYEADIRLRATVQGRLAPFLSAQVEVGRGAGGGSSFSCAGFVPSEALFVGTLAALGAAHGSFDTGLGGFRDASAGSTRSYRVSVTLADDNAAQGLDAEAVWSWEARPS